MGNILVVFGRYVTPWETSKQHCEVFSLRTSELSKDAGSLSRGLGVKTEIARIVKEQR